MLTTQILSEVEELCDDILILNHGRQAARGDLHTLKLLSQGVYDVTVTFDRLPPGIEEELRGEASDPLVRHAQHGRGDVERGRRRHPGGRRRARRARPRAAPRGRRREPRRHLRRADEGATRVAGNTTAPRESDLSALSAVMYREGKIRATNAMFIFWDVVYPLGYLLVFGVGMNKALGFSGLPTDYHAFFLAGVLGMAGFGIASNTAWSFFMDRDNGIFYEMLTYPISRAEYLRRQSSVQRRDRARPGLRHGPARRRGPRRARFAAMAYRCSPRRSSSARPAGFSSTRFSR